MHCFLARSNKRTLSVDLGCGKNPKNPFGSDDVIGVDIVAAKDGLKKIRQCDLFDQPIPFEDSSASFVTAFDFIEHIPRVIVKSDGSTSFRFVELMSEIYRILVPGGIFFSFTPAFPSPSAFRDPTHVNIITSQTFPMYFCAGGRQEVPGARRYGFKNNFIMLAQEMPGSHLMSLMRKPLR